MNTKVWNLMYALGNTGKITGDSANPQRRSDAIAGAREISKNGWTVWVEHYKTGKRIWSSEPLINPDTNMQNKGLHQHRLSDNPEEARFAQAWEEHANQNLKYHLAPAGQEYPGEPSKRDRQVAATVIQWLGSPVGQGWLRDLGYEKKK